MDGTHSDATYKQNFDDENADDFAVFSAFLCPLSIKTSTEYVFQNNSPGDRTKCRPLLISYKRETFEITVSEFKILESAFEKNKRIDVKFFSTWDEKELSFRVNLKPNATMLDGKCLNAILGNAATTRCRACKETHNTNKGDKLFTILIIFKHK